jgi:hypothetical protein
MFITSFTAGTLEYCEFHSVSDRHWLELWRFDVDVESRVFCVKRWVLNTWGSVSVQNHVTAVCAIWLAVLGVLCRNEVSAYWRACVCLSVECYLQIIKDSRYWLGFLILSGNYRFLLPVCSFTALSSPFQPTDETLGGITEESGRRRLSDKLY